MTKYRNQRSEVDGLKFASKKEATRYIYLRSCFESGDIENFIADKKGLRFIICEGVRLPVTLARPARRKLSDVYYETDFRYTIIIKGFSFDVWEDVKGLTTKKFKNKPPEKVPFIDQQSAQKMNQFRIRNVDNKSIVLRICTNVTAHPLDVDDYWY